MSQTSDGGAVFLSVNGAGPKRGTSPMRDKNQDRCEEPEKDSPERTPRDKTEEWWNIGEYLDSGKTAFNNSKFSVPNNRVFRNHREELWDLSDSLAELYESCQSDIRVSTLLLSNDSDQQPKDWLAKDYKHGFIRVYAPDLSTFANSQLVPCTVVTSAHKISSKLGIPLNAIHVQMHGDVIRRLDPHERPLVMQNEYLAGLGYDDIARIQREGLEENLGHLIRFYAGKPMFDSTYSRNQLQALLNMRKGRVMHPWARRLCVLSGTRLLVYKDRLKRTPPYIVQLAKGSVEEVKVKEHDLCLKLISTLDGEKTVYLSFNSVQEYNKWYKKCKKATDKLPTSADLSHCHLEYLPETIFINDQLAMLNVRHNVLRERPSKEDIYTMGWLDDLPKFTRLRSLNLANNELNEFPLSVCQIKTLVELNISSNKLKEIPSEIIQLSNLQALHLHNNNLKTLPDAMLRLRKLFILVLAFNRFPVIPTIVAQMTDVRTSEVENIIMAGNEIETLSPDILSRMRYAKKVDLRMNRLILTPTETAKFCVLEHLTHLDVRDNCIKELDVRPVKTLEYLNCERNEIVSLDVHGQALKNLFAAHNCLEKVSVTPKPEWLLQIDVAHNSLSRLPDWLSDCFFLQKVSAGHNQISELPDRLFTDAKKLKSLRVNHNILVSLPEVINTIFLEELHVQHNLLTSLPPELLSKAIRLRVLNATKNRLSSLPSLNESRDLNKVQELYLTGNSLGDSVMDSISGFCRLKMLHIAHNEIYNIYDNDISKLELLQELNLSGNQLRSLPYSVGQLSKLVVLRAHTNALQTLPDLKQATALKVLDVGHNQLLNVSVTSLMASQIDLLDMSLNAQLKVDPREFRHVRHKKSVCLVDLTGQGRSLPGLSKTSDDAHQEDSDHTLPWKIGFSETAGNRNKLCVTTLKLLKFRNENEAVLGMFDGGHNNEVPKLLLDLSPEVLKEELCRSDVDDDTYMQYTFLTMHRELKATGQKLGASAVLCHVRRVPDSQANQYVLNLANVGDVEAVLCRRGEPLILTKKFTLAADRDECDRVQASDGIITENNMINGITDKTRLLGCAFLASSVIPDPHVTDITLRQDDEFIILANSGLWKTMTYEEAVEEVYDIGNPVVAAKKLQDLAQSYGSRENISILVVRLNTDKKPSLGRLRPRTRSMSIDDIEAAVQHETRRLRRLRDMPSKLRASTGKIKIQKRRVAKASIEGTFDELESEDDQIYSSTEEYIRKSINIDGSPLLSRKTQLRSPSRSPNRSPRRSRQLSPPYSPQGSIALKPLPKQRYRKKDAATGWEGILQKRLSEDVKDKEMKQMTSGVSLDLLTPPEGTTSLQETNRISDAGLRRIWKGKLMVPDWITDQSPAANPAYNMQADSVRRSPVQKRHPGFHPGIERKKTPYIAMDDIFISQDDSAEDMFRPASTSSPASTASPASPSPPVPSGQSQHTISVEVHTPHSPSPESSDNHESNLPVSYDRRPSVPVIHDRKRKKRLAPQPPRRASVPAILAYDPEGQHHVQHKQIERKDTPFVHDSYTSKQLFPRENNNKFVSRDKPYPLSRIVPVGGNSSYPVNASRSARPRSKSTDRLSPVHTDHARFDRSLERGYKDPALSRPARSSSPKFANGVSNHQKTEIPFGNGKVNNQKSDTSMGYVENLGNYDERFQQRSPVSHRHVTRKHTPFVNTITSTVSVTGKEKHPLLMKELERCDSSQSNSSVSSPEPLAGHEYTSPSSRRHPPVQTLFANRKKSPAPSPPCQSPNRLSPNLHRYSPNPSRVSPIPSRASPVLNRASPKPSTFKPKQSVLHKNITRKDTPYVHNIVVPSQEQMSPIAFRTIENSDSYGSFNSGFSSPEPTHKCDDSSMDEKISPLLNTTRKKYHRKPPVSPKPGRLTNTLPRNVNTTVTSHKSHSSSLASNVQTGNAVGEVTSLNKRHPAFLRSLSGDFTEESNNIPAPHGGDINLCQGVSSKDSPISSCPSSPRSPGFYKNVETTKEETFSMDSNHRPVLKTIAVFEQFQREQNPGVKKKTGVVLLQRDERSPFVPFKRTPSPKQKPTWGILKNHGFSKTSDEDRISSPTLSPLTTHDEDRISSPTLSPLTTHDELNTFKVVTSDKTSETKEPRGSIEGQLCSSVKQRYESSLSKSTQEEPELEDSDDDVEVVEKTRL